MDIMLALLTKAWGMEKPNLLISVTGGAKNFAMKARLREVFRRGLMKAAQSTGAWIVTGGTNAGVMKHVGEAVRDFGLTSEGRVTTIGIASWGCVQNKEHLINKEGIGHWPAAYRIEADVKAKQSFLDPNHSHFILVDNGTQHQFTVEIQFRAKLEEAIGNQKTDTGTDAVSVPVCLLVLEGGPGTLETVFSAINSKTPTVVIKGSGKTADILAYAYQNTKEEEITKYDQRGQPIKGTIAILEPHIVAEIREMIKFHFGDANLDTRVGWVKDCCSNRDLLSVFELDSKNSAKDVDLAILKALLKANKNQVMDQLKLALAWNRIDMAKSEIFTDERTWPDVMLSAIKLNRVDFVELFLDNGVVLKDFLTIKRLLTLYNSVSTVFSLADVGHLLQHLLGDFYQPKYLTEARLRDVNVDEVLEGKEIQKNRTVASELNTMGQTLTLIGDPAQDLFIWAVLMNHHKLSKLFWREGKQSSTAACLFASSVLNALKSHTFDAQIMRKFQTASDDYAQLAIGVINNCYSSDEKRTHHLLVHDMPHWGNTTCVLIAVQADNKEFIAQTACQSLLNKVWMGKMSQKNSLMWILTSIVLFPLVQVFIIFNNKDNKKQKMIAVSQDETSLGVCPPVYEVEMTSLMARYEIIKKKCFISHRTAAPFTKPKSVLSSMFEKWGLFYSSPVVKFIVNVVAYLIFLVLYSYILVVELTSEFHYLEGFLMGWVFTIFVEEIRQVKHIFFLTGYAFSFKFKVTSYFHDSWNILDITSIVLFLVGIVLRFIPSEDTLSAARVILSINLITFFSRILHIFSVNKQLGPKLVMIYRMIQDLKWFVVILLVFVVSYAIASEAVLHPNSEPSWALLFYLPRKAYWHIYGELFLDEIEGRGTSDSCTDNATKYGENSSDRCPSAVGKYFVPILLGCYILMTNVLLLNLLIAMFSYTFQQIQDNTDMHWCFQRFNLVFEYTQRPVLPPPLIIFSHIYLLIAYCCRKQSQAPAHSSEFRKIFKNKDREKQLTQWEDVIADNYLNSMEKSERNSVEGRVKASIEKTGSPLKKMKNVIQRLLDGQGVLRQKLFYFAVKQSFCLADELHDSGGQLLPQASVAAEPQVGSREPGVDKRMEIIENQVRPSSPALNWIMSSLQEHKLSSKLQKPFLPDLQSYKQEELQKKRRLAAKESKLAQDLESRESHYKSRISPYPGTHIMRFNVPDDKVHWEIDYPDYNPPIYTSLEILKKPPYADDDLISLTSDLRKNKVKFNDFDERCKISRISYSKVYSVVDGLPLNPVGRTGLKGRGSLGRWGPNHAGDPVVTRWKMLDDGSCAQSLDKPVLEFVAVQRLDNNLWAIPGGICDERQEPWNVLKIDFKESPALKDPKEKQVIQSQLEQFSKNGVEIYKGYADDPRNTDNAWIETRVVNYHDEDRKLLIHLNLMASEGVQAVTWQTIS
ncbi:unnamed protein product, partial [Lymnaea stagnalis]